MIFTNIPLHLKRNKIGMTEVKWSTERKSNSKKRPTRRFVSLEWEIRQEDSAVVQDLDFARLDTVELGFQLDPGYETWRHFQFFADCYVGRVLKSMCKRKYLSGFSRRTAGLNYRHRDTRTALNSVVLLCGWLKTRTMVWTEHPTMILIIRKS